MYIYNISPCKNGVVWCGAVWGSFYNNPRKNGVVGAGFWGSFYYYPEMCCGEPVYMSESAARDRSMGRMRHYNDVIIMLYVRHYNVVLTILLFLLLPLKQRYISFLFRS